MMTSKQQRHQTSRPSGSDTPMSPMSARAAANRLQQKETYSSQSAASESEAGELNN